MTGVGYNQMERLIMLGTGNALVTPDVIILILQFRMMMNISW